MIRALLLMLGWILCGPAAAQHLLTDSWDIRLDARCGEGVVGCNDVRFAGFERRTGRVLRLRGAEAHTLCADGVTPCRFLGWRFKDGGRLISIGDGGELAIRANGKVVLQERGELGDDEEPSAWHGRWRAWREDGKDGKLCRADTAGAGNRRLLVQVEPGGANAWFFVEADALPMHKDEALLRLDGPRPKLYDYDVEISTVKNEAGAKLRVAMPNGYTPEVVRGLQTAASLTLLRPGDGGGPPVTVERFSTTGFPAAWRQLAAWCNFNPAGLFQP